MAGPVNPAGLTDTDVLIDAARGVADAVAFLTTQRAAAGVRTSIISVMELIMGCRNKNELAQVQQFLQHLIVLPWAHGHPPVLMRPALFTRFARFPSASYLQQTANAVLVVTPLQKSKRHDHVSGEDG